MAAAGRNRGQFKRAAGRVDDNRGWSLLDPKSHHRQMAATMTARSNFDQQLRLSSSRHLRRQGFHLSR